jgi:hypothetical protein
VHRQMDNAAKKSRLMNPLIPFRLTMACCFNICIKGRIDNARALGTLVWPDEGEHDQSNLVGQENKAVT